MAQSYHAISWTEYKKTFDRWLALGIAAFIASFLAAALLGLPYGANISPVQLILRALGACAFSLLTLILTLGPLARLSPRFLPLLYNRRHLGVACFMLALVHATLALLWYHGFGVLNPLLSVLSTNATYDKIAGFPFEGLGVCALLILFVMAATSHDFWNATLGPRLWKALHMAVYLAYALLVGHILLGAAQADRGWLYPSAVGVSAFFVAILHLAAGLKTWRQDQKMSKIEQDGWLRVAPPHAIPEGRAVVVVPKSGVSIAVFREDDKIYALANRCRHQGGPLAEGRIREGCIICPWHGYQYQPHNGSAPPPFSERVATYQTRLVAGVVFVHPDPKPLGATTMPSIIAQGLLAQGHSS
jgi:methionine sulfoxide reductase heme-binding subunit